MSEAPSGHTEIAERSEQEITFEDLSSLIKPPPGITDSDIIKFTLQHQENTIKRSLKGLNQGISDIRENWPHATPVQIYIAYELCNNDLETLLLEMGKNEFKTKVDETVKVRLQGGNSTTIQNDEEEDLEDPADNDKSDNDYVESYSADYSYERRKEHKRHSREEFDDDEVVKKRTRRPKDSVIPIDPSLPPPKGVDRSDWAHWSIAKRKSYIGGMSNPNAYFYRNVAPGEVYKTGPFTLEEKKLFLKRVEEFRDKETGTINGEWGLFSRALPGRVGYQCSNYYRKLVDAGELHDPKYIKGEDGMIHHLSHIKSYTAKMKGIDPKKLPKEKPAKHSTKEKKAKNVDPDKIRSISFFSSKLVESTPTRSTRNRQTPITEYAIPYHEEKQQSILSLYDRLALSNPIPGWTDPITGEIMQVPAVSPDYSLLDYNTWLHTIKTKPEDPFTKRPITKRQITVLNFDNWNEYKDKIIEKYAELYAPENFVVE